MINCVIEVKDVTKEFDRRVILRDLSFTVKSGSVLAVTGRNGSGKSTLAKIISGVLSPSSGSVALSLNSIPVKREFLFRSVGFVSPYLQLYDEFTAEENLSIIGSIRKLSADGEIQRLLERVGLWERRNDEVRTFSSGMKQRLKYCAALLHHPPLVILDEPASNLDAPGIEFVRTVMAEQRKEGILIIATNDNEDIRFADSVVDLNVLRKMESEEKK